MPRRLCEICGGSGTDYKFSYSADKYLPERCRTCRGSGFQAKCNDCGQVHSRRQACEYKYWPQVSRNPADAYLKIYPGCGKPVKSREWPPEDGDYPDAEYHQQLHSAEIRKAIGQVPHWRDATL